MPSTQAINEKPQSGVWDRLGLMFRKRPGEAWTHLACLFSRMLSGSQTETPASGKLTGGRRQCEQGPTHISIFKRWSPRVVQLPSFDMSRKGLLALAIVKQELGLSY